MSPIKTASTADAWLCPKNDAEKWIRPQADETVLWDPLDNSKCKWLLPGAVIKLNSKPNETTIELARRQCDSSCMSQRWLIQSSQIPPPPHVPLKCCCASTKNVWIIQKSPFSSSFHLCRSKWINRSIDLTSLIPDLPRELFRYVALQFYGWNSWCVFLVSERISATLGERLS